MLLGEATLTPLATGVHTSTAATDPGAVRASLTGCFVFAALAVGALLATRRAFRPLESVRRT